MSTHLIRCVKKTNRMNPHERITHIGGINRDGSSWTLSQQQAIDGIESDQVSQILECITNNSARRK